MATNSTKKDNNIVEGIRILLNCWNKAQEAQKQQPQTVMLLLFNVTAAIRLEQEITPDEDGILRFRLNMDEVWHEFDERPIFYDDPYDEEDPEQDWTRDISRDNQEDEDDPAKPWLRLVEEE